MVAWLHYLPLVLLDACHIASLRSKERLWEMGAVASIGGCLGGSSYGFSACVVLQWTRNWTGA